MVVRPDNTFEVFVDQASVSSGSLLEDFTPPVNPPKEIDDPDDKKPEDWDEREKIPDPDAEKPDDWDEDAPAKIPDPDAKVRLSVSSAFSSKNSSFLGMLYFGKKIICK